MGEKEGTSQRVLEKLVREGIPKRSQIEVPADLKNTLQELMELGGWSSFEMVLRYAHLRSDHLSTAAKRLEDTNLTRQTQDGGFHLVVDKGV